MDGCLRSHDSTGTRRRPGCTDDVAAILQGVYPCCLGNYPHAFASRRLGRCVSDGSQQQQHEHDSDHGGQLKSILTDHQDVAVTTMAGLESRDCLHFWTDARKPLSNSETLFENA